MNKSTIAIINDSDVTAGSLPNNIISINAWDINWDDLSLDDNYIILGGHMGSYDDQKFTYLQEEKEWLKYAINSNAKIYNKNITILEKLNQTIDYKNKIAAFASWDVFPFIINDKRSGVPVNAGYMSELNLKTPIVNYINKNQKRTPEEWRDWAIAGSKSKAVLTHPDLISPNGLPGPLVYEVELYQGCVRFKRGCKFCIEPKKGVPIWRSTDEVISEISSAMDHGVRNVRIGGATDIYSYQAEGVEELEYPIPDPEPISKILHDVRNDERLSILHVDNGNPSIISENIEPSEEITRTLTETLSDGAILSFGLESADPKVHEMNWLNCNPNQLKTAIRLINKYGREKGERGLPKLLPGLNFIAGLNGESRISYKMNLDLLREIKDEGLWLRRINIRQVEGLGFQEIPSKTFNIFKDHVRQQIDNPLLKEMFPVGTILRDVHWESQDNRIRTPEQFTNSLYWDEKIRGESGITFGRQIGAYPILIGVPYKIPLGTNSDIIVTGHGMRSISGTEIGININEASQKQLEAIPGIGNKGSWKIVSTRAKIFNKQKTNFSSVEQAFQLSDLKLPKLAEEILVAD